jgi:hypothetical protein
MRWLSGLQAVDPRGIDPVARDEVRHGTAVLADVFDAILRGHAAESAAEA